MHIVNHSNSTKNTPSWCEDWENCEWVMISLTSDWMKKWHKNFTPLEQVVRDRTLAGDIMLCSWAIHFTFAVPPSTQEYEVLQVNCRGVTCNGLAFRRGGVEILLAVPYYRNRSKLQELWAVMAPRLHTIKHPQDCAYMNSYLYGKSRELFSLRVRVMFHITK